MVGDTPHTPPVFGGSWSLFGVILLKTLNIELPPPFGGSWGQFNARATQARADLYKSGRQSLYREGR